MTPVPVLSTGDMELSTVPPEHDRGNEVSRLVKPLYSL